MLLITPVCCPTAAVRQLCSRSDVHKYRSRPPVVFSGVRTVVFSHDIIRSTECIIGTTANVNMRPADPRATNDGAGARDSIDTVPPSRLRSYPHSDNESRPRRANSPRVPFRGR
jgi:hypothetical protein